MSNRNPARTILEDFLKNSWPSIEALVNEAESLKEAESRSFKFSYFKDGEKFEVNLNGSACFLRCSVEYSNPQLTVEEVQGLIAARLLEVCGNYFLQYGLKKPGEEDVRRICDLLQNPLEGVVKAFLLNTDDVEPDRYSMNPLRESIVTSGQSAYPSAYVKTYELEVDENFVRKYLGKLISMEEVELIRHFLENSDGSYVDMVDSVKYEQMERLSEVFGINLTLPSIRMPLETLQAENAEGLIHHILREVHKDYSSFEATYQCMGRSMKKRTTLLTVPHSAKGYGSKRAARGRVYFEGEKLKNVRVSYKTTRLYPNAIDPEDVSIAKAEDQFTLEGERLENYSYKETPSSPQFFLYSMASPENAALWHGIGVFAAKNLLKSYASIRVKCLNTNLIRDLKAYGASIRVPLQLNLDPRYMWVHPENRNIDASIGCVEEPAKMAEMGMRVEVLKL
ncbi:MAG: hypothetical protein QW222_01495 [Candidatus Bathyarchaeia archaeon]